MRDSHPGNVWTFAVISALVVCSLSACRQQSKAPPPPQRTENPEHGHRGAVHKGFINWARAGVQPITYLDSDGKAVMEGDMVLGDTQTIDRFANFPATASDPSPLRGLVPAGPADLASQVNSSIEKTKKQVDQMVQPSLVISAGAVGRPWPAGIVPYETVGLAAAQSQAVTAAIQYWERVTPIRFTRHAQEPVFVQFVMGAPGAKACDSNVGRQEKPQTIDLVTGCNFGEVVHEIGHAVGLFHEQSRADRNRYVTIHPENMQPGSDVSDQYVQHVTDGKDAGPYDYDSIMHYGAYDLSANGKPTITPNDPTININRLGQRNGLSAGDLAGVQFLYTAFGSYWKQYDGAATEIAIGSDGRVFVVGTSSQGPHGFDIYQLAPVFRKLPGLAAVKIAVAADGTLWHLNGEHVIYRGTTPVPGAGLEIAAGGDGSVYVIGTTQSAGPHGNDVYQVAPVLRQVPSVSAVRIAVAPDGTLWHLDNLGHVYKGLQQIQNILSMRDIGIGADGSVYMVALRGLPPGGDAPGFVLFRWFAPEGWYQIPDTAATKVAVGPDGYPWVLNSKLEIYRRAK